MKEILGTHEEGMKQADLHVHTNISFDARKGLSWQEVVEFAIETELDLVAITDHGETSGAGKAKEFVARRDLPIDIVSGIEISTDEGHIVGLYIDDPIKTTSLRETIYQIHRHGGLVIVPHPFLRAALGNRPLGLGEEALLSIIEDSSGELIIDGFEVYSEGAREVFLKRKGRSIDSNSKALDFYNKHKEKLGAAISNSDAHKTTIGRARTAYHGNLGIAFADKTTVPMQLEFLEQQAIIEQAIEKFGADRVNASRV